MKKTCHQTKLLILQKKVRKLEAELSTTLEAYTEVRKRFADYRAKHKMERV